MARILIFGGAHMDRRGTLSVPFSPGSSHPGTWHEEAGGGAFNAARVLSRLCHDVTLVAPRGGDAAGEMVSIAAEAANINDQPFIFLDRRTASYTAILDENGNAIAGLADMDLYWLFSPRRLAVRRIRDAISASDAIFMDANLPAETLSAIASRAKTEAKFLGALGISPAKVMSLQGALPQLDMLFINAAEALALSGASDISTAMRILKAMGLKGVVITQGKDMVHGFFDDQETSVEPPEFHRIVDVTGAGDALAGATFSALLNGTALHGALRTGIAAAQITLGSRHAFAPEFSEDLLDHAVQRIFPDKSTIDGEA